MVIIRIALCAGLILVTTPVVAQNQQATLSRFHLFSSAVPRPPRGVPGGIPDSASKTDNASKPVPLPRPRPVVAAAPAADRSEEVPQAAPKAAPRPSGRLYIAPVTPLD
jgi:hypothetical protein